jgi:hypothetical protein
MGNLLKTIGRHVVGAVAGGFGFVGGTAIAASAGSTEEAVAAIGSSVALAVYATVEKILKQLTIKYLGEKSS